MKKLDLSKISEVEVDGVEMSDAMDFCNSYISAANYDGREMTEDELEDLNENHRDFVYEKVIESIY